MLDTGAHFYDVYECADGEYISIGSIEPQFYAELLRLTGLDGDRTFAGAARSFAVARPQGAGWRELFRTKTRDEWCAVMEHTDVCFAPVLRIDEAPQHPHNVARGDVRRRVRCDAAGSGAAVQPHRARAVGAPPAHDGQHTREVLADWGIDASRIETLIESGAVRQA